MAEEHRCQSPKGHRLCVNNCGFIGSPATMNLCSNCYRDFCLKDKKQASMKSTVESPFSSLPSSSSFVSQPSPAIGSISLPNISTVSEKSVGEVEVAAREEEQLTAKATVKPLLPQQPHHHQPNRCSVCRKRVGLTGFKCRCGTTFCGTHRYPETHGCTFDFKTVGREAIAKANPVVKASKLEKI